MSKVYSCTDNAIKEAANIIRKGGFVVYPTDTLYGLGADATDEAAVKAVFDLKKRDYSKPLSIAVCDLKMVRRYTSFSSKDMKMMEAFFPGPITLILEKRNLPASLTAGSEKIGIRIPDSRTALKLIMEAGVPIVSTSANISGREPPATADEAAEQLPSVDMVLDSGRLSGAPSVVVDLTADPPVILRGGGKPEIEIRTVLKEIYG